MNKDSLKVAGSRIGQSSRKGRKLFVLYVFPKYIQVFFYYFCYRYNNNVWKIYGQAKTKMLIRKVAYREIIELKCRSVLSSTSVAKFDLLIKQKLLWTLAIFPIFQFCLNVFRKFKFFEYWNANFNRYCSQYLLSLNHYFPFIICLKT